MARWRVRLGEGGRDRVSKLARLCVFMLEATAWERVGVRVGE